MSLNNLAQRVEAASGADWELDALIESDRRRWQAYACGLSDKTRAYWVADSQGYVESQGTRYAAPAYTASIDAALTLVGDEHWRVEDHPLAGPCAIVGDSEGYAATPALALCAAALRARQEKNDGR